MPNVLYNTYMLGGVLPYVLGGFFTEGVPIKKTLIFHMFFTPVIKFHPYCYGLFPIFSDYFRFQFCSKKAKNVQFFSVSLELRCIFGLE